MLTISLWTGDKSKDAAEHQRPLSLVETEAAAVPLVGAAPEVMMKYIESLDGPGEGIFQNNRIAQLKPNCPPFVTVCLVATWWVRIS